MGLPRRLTADAVAAVLLATAAAVLVATPYDGGSCRNVFSAYALPAASVEPAERPEPSPALDDAYAAVAQAQADETALATDRSELDQAIASAGKARAAATEAEEEAYDASWSTGSYDVDSAEAEVEYAEDLVDSAEEWLTYVEGEAASGDEWAIYDDTDIAQAQEELDDARDELAAAQAELADAAAVAASEESAAASAEQTAEDLEAAADAAEAAAQHAADVLTAKESAVADRLDSAQARVVDLEVAHEVALAEWAHDRRVAEDEVVARNHVRDSCRDNGVWRAGIAGVDVLLLGAVAFRALRPRLPRVPVPWRRR